MASRRWCFTLNNYVDNDETIFQELECVYIVYGREVGANLTPHLQGFVTFAKLIRLGGMKKIHPGAHWEATKGTSPQASEYCKKDGNYFEKGVTPTQGKRNDLELVTSLIKSGTSVTTVALNHSSVYVKYYRGLEQLALKVQQPYGHSDVRGVWFVGAPGTGKSRTARDLYPGAYLKSQNKWWDGYNGEETVILDDFDKGGTCLGHLLKIWADRYPCTGETKGGTVHLRHHRFVVTSNYLVSEIFVDEEEIIQALRNTFQLSDEMDDKKTVYKYGFTNDMKRRLGEHQRDYGKLVNVEIELELFNYIDVKYTSEAEGDIRDLFDGFGKSLQVEGRNELVVLNSREFQRVKKEYTRTGREYAGATQVLQEEISRLKTELVEVRLSHKIELQAERNEKDKYKTLVETNERIHQLEKQNYELQIKMNQCGRT